MTEQREDLNRRGRHYSPAEVAHIRARYPFATTRTIAAELGRSQHGVLYIVTKFNLKRTAKQTSAVYKTWTRTMPKPRQKQQEAA